MGGWQVSPAKYVTCVCGKVCKGRAGFANHARKCPQEIARSEAVLAELDHQARSATSDTGRALYRWADVLEAQRRKEGERSV